MMVTGLIGGTEMQNTTHAGFRAIGRLRFGLLCRGLVCLSLVYLSLSACSLDSARPFRIGTNVWPGYEPLYLARALGLYDNSGIKLVELANASAVLQALRAGTLEGAALTLDEALSVAQDGYDLRIVAVLDFSRGGDALVAQPGLRRLADLRGRRIGVENTAVGAIMLDAALRQAGMRMADVQMVPVTLDAHRAAFGSGEVDAVVTFEPVKSLLLGDGAVNLFDSGRIPDRIVDVLVVSTQALAQHGDRVRQLLHGHFQGLRHLREDPLGAAAIMAGRLRVPPEAVAALYEGIHQPGLAENRRLLGAGTRHLYPSVERLVRLMLDRRMLHRAPDTRAMLSAEWLPETP